VHDAHGVAVVDSHDDCPELLLGQGLREEPVLKDGVQQLRALAELGHDVDVLGGCVLVDEADDVGRVHCLEDFYFVLDVLQELHGGRLVLVQLDFLHGHVGGLVFDESRFENTSCRSCAYFFLDNLSV